MSAFGGKADMPFCRGPLSRSLSGAKRTCLIALHMSASDPKRTWTRVGNPDSLHQFNSKNLRQPGMITAMGKLELRGLDFRIEPDRFCVVSNRAVTVTVRKLVMTFIRIAPGKENCHGDKG